MAAIAEEPREEEGTTITIISIRTSATSPTPTRRTQQNRGARNAAPVRKATVGMMRAQMAHGITDESFREVEGVDECDEERVVGGVELSDGEGEGPRQPVYDSVNDRDERKFIGGTYD